jgi:hypothetical protein
MLDELLNAGGLACPKCGAPVVMMAIALSRDKAGMPIVEQKRSSKCGSCEQLIVASLLSNNRV